MRAPEPYPEGTPSWVDLATTDAAGAKAFYAALFGWEFEDIFTDQGVPYTMASKDGVQVAGLSANAQGDLPPTWFTYLSVSDCDACTARAVAAGGSVMMEPMDVMDAGRMSFVIDPTGAHVGLWEARRHRGAALIDEPGAYTWAELYTNDGEAAAAFYRASVGLETVTDDFGGGPYTMFKAGDRVVGGLLPPPVEEVPNHWHVYFGVADTDAAVTTVGEAGGEILVGPLDTPVGRMATVHDPFGAAFSVIALNEWP